MNLPDAKATLTPRVAASDYVYFQRDLIDLTGRRRGPDQTSGVFTRDWQGNEFRDGVLYCFCASSPTVGDDALIGFFNAAGQAIAYEGQPVASPADLSADEQQLIAPQPPPIDARAALLASLSFDLLVRCAQEGGYPDFDEADFDPNDFESTAENPHDPLFDSNEFTDDFAQ